MEGTYRLYLSWPLKLLPFLLFGAFAVTAVLMLVPGSPLDDPELPYLFRLFWLALAVFLWYRILVLPHRIEVDAVGRVTFVSVLRRVQLPATGIESIRPTVQPGFFMVRHARGRMLLLAQFDDFHVFLTGLEARNPGVDLRGC